MDLYGAIADPTRRRILEALRLGPATVNDLAEEVGYHQPGVSRHLRVLREAGLVQAHPDGQQRLYSLVLEPFIALDGWVHAFLRVPAGRLDRLAGVVDPRRMR